MKRKLIVPLMLLILIGGCAKQEEIPEDLPSVLVNPAQKGDYQISTPFKSSPLRQIHAITYRETDIFELGRRLLEKSKTHFPVDKFLVSEGQIIDVDMYYDLISFKSDDNPDGLTTRYETLALDGVTLDNPSFISDIFEYNFHHFGDVDKVEGVAVGLVLQRVQYTDYSTGALHYLSDDALFNVGQTLGLQLAAYLRNEEGMADAPIYIALYAQSSDMDRLPGNYLPGQYIGDGYSKDRTMKFTQNKEKWIMLSDSEASELVPEVESGFYQLRNKIIGFVGDESTGLIGRAFVVENELSSIRLEVNIAPKTYLELYALGQYITQEIDEFSKFEVPVKVDIHVLGNTRVTITKNVNEKAVMSVFE